LYYTNKAPNIVKAVFALVPSIKLSTYNLPTTNYAQRRPSGLPGCMHHSTDCNHKSWCYNSTLPSVNVVL